MEKLFDFNKISDFDDHINKSIPNYDLLIEMIKNMSEYFYTPNCSIYDLGCSTGKLLKSLHFDCKKFGYDNSNLLPDDTQSINFSIQDLNGKFPISNACLVYSIFTMQFLDPMKRKQYIQQIYEGMVPGGCLFITEKIYQDAGIAQEIFSFSHYDFKLKQFSADEILKKEKDLRYNMKPLQDETLVHMLKLHFRIVTPFWQMFNFKGYICIR